MIAGPVPTVRFLPLADKDDIDADIEVCPSAVGRDDGPAQFQAEGEAGSVAER